MGEKKNIDMYLKSLISSEEKYRNDFLEDKYEDQDESIFGKFKNNYAVDFENKDLINSKFTGKKIGDITNNSSYTSEKRKVSINRSVIYL